MKALVILSGGQDSTTCLALAIQKHGARNVRAVSFDYGQRHAEELNAASRIARMAGLITDGHHEIIDAKYLLEGTSPLVSANAVEQYASAAVLPGGLEKTFVPMRNSLFLILAANRAVVWSLGNNSVVEMYTGVGQEDYGGYPDCRETFIELMERTINASLDDPTLPQIKIVTPLMHLTKAETVRLSESIPGCREMLAWSHTCYNGEVPPCGNCHACLLRQKGYAEAGFMDPLLERLYAP